jgi:hypothetical protein
VVRATDMSPHMDISGVQVGVFGECAGCRVPCVSCVVVHPTATNSPAAAASPHQQTYIINQAKVMFLNQRPQSKMSRPGAADACLVCARTLREGCSYCSLSCKVEALAGGVGAGCAAAPGGNKAQTSLLKHASGSASDSSDCWGVAPCSSGGANNVAHTAHADCSGDSSSSGQTLAAAAAAVVAEGGAWGCSHEHLLQDHDQQHSRGVGAAAAAWARRHSDSDSEARSSAGSYCARRKQASPRRSPLL